MDLLRLAALTYLQPLSIRELATIAPCAAEIAVPAGRRVLLDGPLHQELVLVATGRGSVRCAGETIGELGPGDAFGTLAAPRSAYATATVTALTPLRLVTFSTHEVRYLRRTAAETLDALLAVCAAGPAPRGHSRGSKASAAAPAPPPPPPRSIRRMTVWPPPGDGGAPRPHGDAERATRATRVVHAGLPAAAQGTPFLPGPTLAAPYHLIGPTDATPYGYGRYANPTWTGYEAALGELEGGEAVLFASGLAAVAAVLLPALQPGDVVVVPADGYPGVTTIAVEQLRPHGVEVRVVPTDDAAIRAALPGATLVWIETPSNPGLVMLDVAALAAAAHDAGALLAVDNTLATPLLQRPLELGADLSISSASKGLTGHSDLVLGYVAVADPARAAQARAWRSLTGAIAGPFEAWLAHRSLATLDVRHVRQCANALALAQALVAREDVRGVRYPGLPGDPGHELAARVFGGERFGGVLCFDLVTEVRAQAFLGAAALIAEATSFGGVHSSAERRGRWGIDDVSPGFIRMSAGVEDPGDLVADVCAALDASGS